MEVFYRKRNGAREVIAKKEKEIFRPGHLFGAKGRVFVFVFVFVFFFIVWIVFFLLGGMERAHVTDYLTGAENSKQVG